MSDQEDNGLFGFDFDDDVFVTKEEKERVVPSQLDYVAKFETDGVRFFRSRFFDISSKRANVLEHSGFIQIKASTKLCWSNMDLIKSNIQLITIIYTSDMIEH